MDEINKLYQEYHNLLEQQLFTEEALDYELLDKHISFLKQMDVLDSSSLSIFDMYKKEHIYVSSNYYKMLGYDLSLIEDEGNAFFDRKVHPDDFLVNLRNGIELLKFSFNIPIEHRKDYKLISEYRVINGNGNYIRIIEQQQVLELDKHGNIWTALSTVDISPEQDMSLGVKSQIYNFRTRELVPFSKISKSLTRENPLSKRESQVLGMIKDGLMSKEIAEKLFISIHTVNTHRQRILEKLNVSNSYEAIQYVTSLGITD